MVTKKVIYGGNYIMYEIKFLDNEKIELISDNTLVYTKDGEKNCSSVVTNMRYLILDYPSGVYNSMEDLRTSGKITYIKKKEIILSVNINDINKIVKDNDYDKILLNNQEYVMINDNEIVEYLERKL